MINNILKNMNSVMKHKGKLLESGAEWLVGGIMAGIGTLLIKRGSHKAQTLFQLDATEDIKQYWDTYKNSKA